MTITLVAVAQRAKATLYRHAGPGRGLVEVESLAHPEARRYDREVDADRPGRVQDSHGRHHAMEREQSPKERAAEDFAREVAHAIERHRVGEGFGRLILVAEPGFLGLLRAALDRPTARLVTGEVHKELTDVSLDTLTEHLGDVLAV
jgi:protein required for attachment to host cells